MTGARHRDRALHHPFLWSASTKQAEDRGFSGRLGSRQSPLKLVHFVNSWRHCLSLQKATATSRLRLKAGARMGGSDRRWSPDRGWSKLSQTVSAGGLRSNLRPANAAYRGMMWFLSLLVHLVDSSDFQQVSPAVIRVSDMPWTQTTTDSMLSCSVRTWLPCVFDNRKVGVERRGNHGGRARPGTHPAHMAGRMVVMSSTGHSQDSTSKCGSKFCLWPAQHVHPVLVPQGNSRSRRRPWESPFARRSPGTEQCHSLSPVGACWPIRVFSP